MLLTAFLSQSQGQNDQKVVVQNWGEGAKSGYRATVKYLPASTPGPQAQGPAAGSSG